MRKSDDSAEKFDQLKYVFLVVCLVALSALQIFQLVTPPEDLAKSIESNSSNVTKISDGFLFSAPGFRANVDFPPIGKQKIHLPDRPFEDLNKLTKSSIWYEFSIPPALETRTQQLRALLIPRVWGRSKVYLDGSLRDFGKNIRPIIALPSAATKVHVNVDASNEAIFPPIRATYPPVVGDADYLRVLSSQADSQLQQYPRSMAVYGLAIILFGMLFVAYPKKPELLAFVSFLIASMFSVYIESLQDQNVLLAWNWGAQQVLVLCVDLVKNLTLLWFSLLFFRAHPARAMSTVANCFLFCAIVGTASILFLFKAFNSSSYRMVGQLFYGCTFLIVHLYTVGPRLAFSSLSIDVPRQRKIACAVVFTAIVALYLMNNLDFFFLISAVTTLPRNNLILHLTISIVVAFESARAEVNQLILGSMLPREVREGLNTDKEIINQSGFVILFDAMGYSANRGVFDDIAGRAQFIQNLAKRMLIPISNLNDPEISILSCTGDGIYCVIRGEATRKNLDRAIALAAAVVSDEQINASDARTIQFRAAIAYGNYFVRIIEVGRVRKEFVAGNVLNDLSRVIGSESDRPTIRLRVCEVVSGLGEFDEIEFVLDKHGFKHEYVDLKRRKMAA